MTLPIASRGIRVHFLLLLGGLFFLALFLGLEPLGFYPIWGSDTGEYYYLTNYLVEHGQFLLSGYPGKGFGYPFFPGMFILGGAVSEATSAPVLSALQVTVPVLGAFAVLPLFLLFRRLFPSDGVALTAAGIATVAFPRIFILAHSVPDTLGDVLAVSSLWMLVEQRRDARWMVPLFLTSGALIISHHLSSYFLLILGLTMVVGLEFVTPGRWSRRFPVREFVFFGIFSLALFSYWILYAVPFRRELTDIPFLHVSSDAILILLVTATLAVIVLAAVFVHLRRGRFSKLRSIARPKWATDPKLIRDFTLLMLFIVSGALLLVVFPIPGTTQRIPLLDVLWFLPLISLVPLSAGGIGTSAGSRLAPIPYAWVMAILISATGAAVLNIQALPVERHAEWAVIAMAMLVAVGLGGLVARTERSDWKRFAVGGIVCVLIGANAWVALPPPQATDGFQEGFTPQDLALAGWGAHSVAIGTTLAADYRLSDMYFGLSGNPATWSNTCVLFLGNLTRCGITSGNVSREVAAELNDSLAPNHLSPVDAVAVDQTMISVGVALDPSQPTYPMAPSQLAFLQGPDFVLLYENGPQEMWWFTGT